MRWLVLLVLALGLQATAEYCEWHLDYLVYHRVNYTDDPWSFSVDRSCTALQCSTYLWGSIDDKGAASLAKALRGAPQLEELTVAYNSIGDAGAVELADALRHMPRLRLLHLGWNGIGDVGARALAEALEHEPLLEELNMFWNNVGEAGTEALAAALRHTPKLRKLNLAWNGVGNRGAAALAEALRSTSQLTELSVAWSGIGNAGAIALAGALGRLPKLRELRMRWNAFTETGAIALAGALVALEEAHARHVLSSGIPWPILEAARNASRQAVAARTANATASPPRPTRLRDRAPAQSVTCATARCSALVVAIANYTRGAPVASLEDARELAAVLGRLGFEVSRLVDATFKKLLSGLKAFSKALEAGGIGVLYFGGQGFQFNGTNYMMPADHSMEQGETGVHKAVPLPRLLQSLARRRAAASVVVLDVSRPSAPQSKAALEGLAPVAATLGTLVALPGVPSGVRRGSSERAASGEAGSLYARQLAAQLQEPGLRLEEVFKRVRLEVANATGGRQVPWESSALVADVVLNPGSGEDAAAAAGAIPAWVGEL